MTDAFNQRGEPRKAKTGIIKRSIRRRKQGLFFCTLRRDCAKRVRRPRGQVARNASFCGGSTPVQLKEAGFVFDEACKLVGFPEECSDKEKRKLTLDNGKFDYVGDADGDKLGNGVENDLLGIAGTALGLNVCEADTDQDDVLDSVDLDPLGEQDDESGIKVKVAITKMDHEDATAHQESLDDLEPGNDDPYLPENTFLGTGAVAPGNSSDGSLLQFREFTFADHQDGAADSKTGYFEMLGDVVSLPEDLRAWVADPPADLFGPIGQGALRLPIPTIGLVLLPLDHDDGCNNDMFIPNEPPYDGYCPGQPGTAAPPDILANSANVLDLALLLWGATDTVAAYASGAGTVPNQCVPGYAITFCFEIQVQNGLGEALNRCALANAVNVWTNSLQSSAGGTQKLGAVVTSVPASLLC
jgi:hypothetical protein